jgi:hypothetical protein
MSEAETYLAAQQSPTPFAGIFEAVGASIVGPRHLAAGKACEDFFKLEMGADWVVAVVSDGAGSASRAIDGARAVSEEICRILAAWLAAPTSRDRIRDITFSDWIEAGVCEGIERARERCLLETREHEGLAAFHATVVGAVMLGEHGALFHIGDGCASTHRNTANCIETIAFSEPENGEYINETFFFTEKWWREHLRVTEIAETADEAWLMTDGAYELVVPPRQKHLRDFTVLEINRLVFSEPTEDRANVLKEILSSPQAKRNDDDKTIVIVRRLPPNG